MKNERRRALLEVMLLLAEHNSYLPSVVHQEWFEEEQRSHFTNSLMRDFRDTH